MIFGSHNSISIYSIMIPISRVFATGGRLDSLVRIGTFRRRIQLLEHIRDILKVTRRIEV